MATCHMCKNCRFWECGLCRKSCCVQHIDYFYWGEQSPPMGLSGKGAWLCLHCITQLKEWKAHATKTGCGDGK
jgi:hypothetical protein